MVDIKAPEARRNAEQLPYVIAYRVASTPLLFTWPPTAYLSVRGFGPGPSAMPDFQSTAWRKEPECDSSTVSFGARSRFGICRKPRNTHTHKKKRVRNFDETLGKLRGQSMPYRVIANKAK